MEQVELRIDLEANWGNKYHAVTDCWYQNWDKLSTYFRYDKAIKKLIYNSIEVSTVSCSRSPRQRGDSHRIGLAELIYMAHGNIKKKWTTLIRNWISTMQTITYEIWR